MTNLLELVLPMISNIIDPRESVFKYRCLIGEQRNELGVKIPQYGPWGSIQGSVQPVQRSRYEALGLDFAKNYINVWGSVALLDLGRQKAPDQILWRGKLWNITSLTEWNPHNGWMNCTAVEDKRWDGESN